MLKDSQIAVAIEFDIIFNLCSRGNFNFKCHTLNMDSKQHQLRFENEITKKFISYLIQTENKYVLLIIII